MYFLLVCIIKICFKNKASFKNLIYNNSISKQAHRKELLNCSFYNTNNTSKAFQYKFLLYLFDLALNNFLQDANMQKA